MAECLNYQLTPKMIKIQKEYVQMLRKLRKLPDKKSFFPVCCLHLPAEFLQETPNIQEELFLKIYETCLKEQITWQEYYQKTDPSVLSPDICW